MPIQPFCLTKPIENMPAKWVLLRQARVGKVVCCGRCHAEPLRDFLRAKIDSSREGNELCQLKRLEGIPCYGLCCFRRVASAPMGGGEPPTYFYARREVFGKHRHRQADVADERSFLAYLNSPKTKSMPVQLFANAQGGSIAFCSVEWLWIKLHHTRVSIHRGEGFKVSVTPAAEGKPLRDKAGCHTALSFVKVRMQLLHGWQDVVGQQLFGLLVHAVGVVVRAGDDD